MGTSSRNTKKIRRKDLRSWPWISGNHRSFNFNGARLSRTDTLNEFDETSYEFTPRIGTYLGENGPLEGKFSLFRMKSDVDGKTLDPDNEDTLRRLGAALGWDTRDSWNYLARGGRTSSSCGVPASGATATSGR